MNCNLWTWIHVYLLLDCYCNINKCLILSYSSNIIPVYMYRYHLTGEWTGVPSVGMHYGMDNGMYNWWHHCVLDSFVSSYRSQE